VHQKNAHPDVVDRLKLRLGQGITGWVAEHRQPVAVALNASQDPRFQLFKDLPEDKFEAFLSVPVCAAAGCRCYQPAESRPARIFGARNQIDLDHWVPGRAEIEMARLESENLHLSEKLVSGKSSSARKEFFSANSKSLRKRRI